jgi:hypothetical protein
MKGMKLQTEVQQSYAGNGKQRRKGSRESNTQNWEPDPNTSNQRPRIHLLPRSKELAGNAIAPIRQPKGPDSDGSRGFTSGRGKLVIRK